MGSFELRPIHEDDLPAIGDLVARVEAHDRIPHAVSLQEIREDLDQPHVDLDEDTRVALVDGEVVGWSWVWNIPSETRLERAFCIGDVDPAHRGQGIGRALLGWCCRRAVERLRARPHDLPRYVRVVAYDWLEADQRLYRRLGFVPVRWAEELLRALVDLPDAAVPDGIDIIDWPMGEREEELRVLRNEAFADHWGSAPVDEPTWDQELHGHGARLDLSSIAVVRSSGEAVGLCLNNAFPADEAMTGRRDAWIQHLATARSWRGRGVASALLAVALRTFAASGEFTHAAIGVDADNLTGAARLYRTLGFEPTVRSVTYEIELPGA